MSIILYVFVQLDDDASSTLNQLQQTLNGILDELSGVFANRFLSLLTRFMCTNYNICTK